MKIKEVHQQKCWSSAHSQIKAKLQKKMSAATHSFIPTMPDVEFFLE